MENVCRSIIMDLERCSVCSGGISGSFGSSGTHWRIIHGKPGRIKLVAVVVVPIVVGVLAVVVVVVVVAVVAVERIGWSLRANLETRSEVKNVLL